MTCPTPKPANLPDWLKTVLQDALPELRTIRYDLEVYQPKDVFEKHAERISKLISIFQTTLTGQVIVQDKNEFSNLRDQFARLAMQSILQAEEISTLYYQLQPSLSHSSGHNAQTS